MSNTNTNTNSLTDQLGVTTTTKRADQLRLGDWMLVASWVMQLRLLNDDVEVRTTRLTERGVQSTQSFMSVSTTVTVAASTL